MRVLNHITWKKIAQFEHPATISNTRAVSSSIAITLYFCQFFAHFFQSFLYMLCMIPGGVQRSGETASNGQHRPVTTEHDRGLHPHQRSQQMCDFKSLCFDVDSKRKCFLTNDMSLQTSSPHHPSSFLWSNRTQTEQTPRLASLLWCSAQTVGI